MKLEIKKGMAVGPLIHSEMVLTQRDSSAPDFREEGGKICTTWGIRTLYLRRGLPCDRDHKGKGLKPLFPQQELYQRLSKL